MYSLSLTANMKNTHRSNKWRKVLYILRKLNRKKSKKTKMHDVVHSRCVISWNFGTLIACWQNVNRIKIAWYDTEWKKILKNTEWKYAREHTRLQEWIGSQASAIAWLMHTLTACSHFSTYMIEDTRRYKRMFISEERWNALDREMKYRWMS